MSPLAPAAAVVASLLLAVTGCGREQEPGPPQLRYGQLADVQVGGTGELVPLRATVRSTERSSAEALDEGGLEKVPLQGRVPWFVRVSYENPTGRAFAGPPEQQFRPRQADGQYAVRLDIVSDRAFLPCQDVEPPESFDAVGGTADACLVVLVAADQAVTSVEWTFPDRRTEAVWRPA